MALCIHCEKRESEGAGWAWYGRGWLLFHTHGWRAVEGCGPCFRQRMAGELVFNSVAAWWCFPWGLLTPLIVGQNLVVLLRGPSLQDQVLLQKPAGTPHRGPSPRSIRSRAVEGLQVEAQADGAVQITIPPSQTLAPLWLVGLVVGLALLWPLAVAGVVGQDPEFSLPPVFRYAGGVVVASVLFSGVGYWFASRTTGWVITYAGEALEVRRNRRWLAPEVTSIDRAAVRCVSSSVREVRFEGSDVRIAMPGRSPVAVNAIARELDGLLRLDP